MGELSISTLVWDAARGRTQSRPAHSPAVVDKQTQQDQHQQRQRGEDGEQEHGVVGAEVCDARGDGDQPCAGRSQVRPTAPPRPALPGTLLTTGRRGHSGCPVAQLRRSEGPVELAALPADHAGAVADPQSWRGGGVSVGPGRLPAPSPPRPAPPLPLLGSNLQAGTPVPAARERGSAGSGNAKCAGPASGTSEPLPANSCTLTAASGASSSQDPLPVGEAWVSLALDGPAQPGQCLAYLRRALRCPGRPGRRAAPVRCWRA